MIGPYLDGAIGECRWLEEHVNDCAECLAEYEIIQRINHLARKADLAPPESGYWRNFSNRTLARIMGRIPLTRENRGWTIMMRLPVFWRFLAAGSLVLAVAMILILPEREVGDRAGFKSLPESMNNADSGGFEIKRASFETELSAGSIAAAESLPHSFAAAGGSSIAEPDETRSTAYPGAGELRLKGGWRDYKAPSLTLADNDLKTVDVSGRLYGEAPSTELMMRLQIAGNQNINLIPLHIYRTDGLFYFAGDLNKYPSEVSKTRPGSRWGYASGERYSDRDHRFRYELELRLIESK